MVGDAVGAALRVARRLGRARVEVPVDLARVGGDDFSVQGAGQGERELGLSGSGGADEDERVYFFGQKGIFCGLAQRAWKVQVLTQTSGSFRPTRVSQSPWSSAILLIWSWCFLLICVKEMPTL